MDRTTEVAAAAVRPKSCVLVLPLECTGEMEAGDRPHRYHIDRTWPTPATGSPRLTPERRHSRE